MNSSPKGKGIDAAQIFVPLHGAEIIPLPTEVVIAGSENVSKTNEPRKVQGFAPIALSPTLASPTRTPLAMNLAPFQAQNNSENNSTGTSDCSLNSIDSNLLLLTTENVASITKEHANAALLGDESTEIFEDIDNDANGFNSSAFVTQTMATPKTAQIFTPSSNKIENKGREDVESARLRGYNQAGKQRNKTRKVSATKINHTKVDSSNPPQPHQIPSTMEDSPNVDWWLSAGTVIDLDVNGVSVDVLDIVHPQGLMCMVKILKPLNYT